MKVTPEPTMIRLRDVSKTFVMHLQSRAQLPVVRNVSLDVCTGECVVLGGPSGIGKSSILKMIYGNYLADGGAIEVRGEDGWVDVVTAPARQILKLRETTLGYVSQFLRVIPRVGAFDLVAAVVPESDDPDEARREAAAKARTRELLERLNVPERLWSLPPATFSGGEQQRINIARGFAAARPILLLDEPTASLDAANRQVVIDLILEHKAAGAALIGIFHDPDVRDAVGDRTIDVRKFAPEAVIA